MSLVSAFDFDLPTRLIAQQPRPRGLSRLLVVDRETETWREASIGDLPSILSAGDLLIANDTRVFPARLIGHRDPSGGAVECLLLERADDDRWWALVHPGQKLKVGMRFICEDESRAPGVRIVGSILERHFFGRRLITLQSAGHFDLPAAIEALGHVPLPPYIRRPDSESDRERYQTVYARVSGSVAAPTAGLHFDDQLIGRLQDAGIEWRTITLHVGYGTFKPVRTEHVEDHRVDAERYVVPEDVIDAIRRRRASPGRVIAVGTTTTRALEAAAGQSGQFEARSGTTDLFISPGHQFRVVDAMLTNFHLPRSSLLMLVAAFAGVDLILAAYAEAVRREFRFYSYGDAMLIL